MMVPATRDVQSPIDDQQTYYDYWKQWSQQGDSFNPEVSPFVGSGSDHASFIFYAGVPVMDIMFLEDKKLYPNIGGYPAYHTGFETMELVETIYDPDYKIFRACAQLNLRLGLELADVERLSFKMENYAKIMEDGFKVLEDGNVIKRLGDLGINTTHFNESIGEFRIAAELFDELAMDDSMSEYQIQVMNNQMRGFERNFLLYEGLPDRIQYRHVVTAPSLFDAYGGSAFPGIGDLLYKLDEVQGDTSSSEYKAVLKQIKKHVSDLMIIIKRAAHYLKPIPTFELKSSGDIVQTSALFVTSLSVIVMRLLSY